MDEAEPGVDVAGARVVGVDLETHAVQPDRGEGVLEHEREGTGADAAVPAGPGEPEPQLARAVARVQVQEQDLAEHGAVGLHRPHGPVLVRGPAGVDLGEPLGCRAGVRLPAGDRGRLGGGVHGAGEHLHVRVPQERAERGGVAGVGGVQGDDAVAQLRHVRERGHGLQVRHRPQPCRRRSSTGWPHA